MSHTYCVPIDDEHSSVTFDHELLAALTARNLSVDVEQLYSVGTIRHGSDDSSGYLMAAVSHLTAPLDTVDVAEAERQTTYICGCPGFYFNCYDEQVGAKISDCKHVKDAKRAQRGMDDKQAKLL